MKYPNLMSPVKIRGFVLKNRMEMTTALPHFSQGPERYPSDEVIRSYIDHARNGAGIVTVAGVNDSVGLGALPQEVDISHFPSFDIYDPKCQNYMVQLTEALHSFGTIVSMALVPVTGVYPYRNERGETELIMANKDGAPPAFRDIKDAVPDAPTAADDATLDMDSCGIGDEVPCEAFEKIAASFGQQAAQLKFLGFDMITVHMSYRSMVAGKMLSPLTNFRTDDYGGDITGRAKFPLMILKSIRDAVGEKFLIEFHVSGEEPVGGNTVDDTIAFLRMAEKYADIVQIRAGDGADSEITGFTLEKTPMLPAAEKIKKAGLNLLVSNSGGWHNPDDAEAAIRDGKLDLIAMARAFISNPNYGELVMNGRTDDIVPCVRCNRCHGRSESDPFATTCTVNPVFGLERLTDSMTSVPSKKHTVAIVGGGPGGMRTAIWLAERGHTVTIFEAREKLGGALRHTDHVDFKWPLRDYKNYLVHQVEKHQISVHLNTYVVPDELKGKYDVVIAAIGAEPIMPPIPGLNSGNVISAVEALECADRVGKTAVVIGGGEVGMETGIYLARTGRTVTVLEQTSKLAANATKIHYWDTLRSAWEHTPGLDTIVNATVTEIGENGVVYKDDSGCRKLIADTVILAVGMKSKSEEAMKFHGISELFYMVGDCKKTGTIQTTNRSAYYAANNI